MGKQTRQPTEAGQPRAKFQKLGSDPHPSAQTNNPVFVCATGAGGGRSRQVELRNHGEIHEFEFAGRPNLTTPTKELQFCKQFVAACEAAQAKHGSEAPIYLVGHSFGGRVALHTWVNPETRTALPSTCKGIISFGYPLIHATQHRERKLMELPESCRVLFISGDRDSFMGDGSLLRTTLESLPHHETRFSVCLVRGADHSLKCAKKYELANVELINDAIHKFLE